MLLFISAVFSITRIFLLTGSMNGNFRGMWDLDSTRMILAAGEGRATALRLIGLGLAAFALVENSVFLAPAIIGACIAAASFAAIGHIHGLQSNGVPTLLLILHLLCAAFWLGALRPLLLVAQSSDLERTAVIAARFGRSALIGVAVLLSAGSSLLWILITHAGQFWSSDYGKLVALKLLLVALLLSLAAGNKLHLTPGLERHEARAALLLRRSIRFEMLIGALILLVTAGFTTLTGPPP